VRLFTAREWSALGWYGRARVHARRRAQVARLEAEHHARYPDAQRALCGEPGCLRRSRALGICATHYKRLRRLAA
jgi:hypothetical protein